MIRYRISVVDDAGDLVAGASLRCADDTSAKARFAAMPLPPGRAELWRGARLVASRPEPTLAASAE